MAGMANPAPYGAAASAKKALAEELARQLAAARGSTVHAIPILRHLLRSDDHSVFSDEIVARVRGMFLDVARHLIIALAEAAGHCEPEGWAHEAADELAHVLIENPVFLEHFHALALEWQWTEQLVQRRALDPVLPPLLQAQMGDADTHIAAAAMNLLAAQARFCQNQRRMQMPLGELPGNLLHIALVSMRTYVGIKDNADGYVLIAERSVRGRFDEARGRLGLMRRVLDAMADRGGDMLVLDSAGLALFLSAIAQGSGQSRETVIMALAGSQMVKLAVILKACGLAPDAAAAALQALYPDAVLPVDALEIGADQANALLTAATAAA
jgi:hypothetical protein